MVGGDWVVRGVELVRWDGLAAEVAERHSLIWGQNQLYQRATEQEDAIFLKITNLVLIGRNNGSTFRNSRNIVIWAVLAEPRSVSRQKLVFSLK